MGKGTTLKCRSSNCCRSFDIQANYFWFYSSLQHSRLMQWICKKSPNPNLLKLNICLKILTSFWTASFRTDQRYQNFLCYLTDNKINAWTVTSAGSLSKRHFYLLFFFFVLKKCFQAKKLLLWKPLLFKRIFNLEVLLLFLKTTSTALQIYLTKSKYFLLVSLGLFSSDFCIEN